MKQCIAFFKKEAVFSIATALAIVSMFFVRPDRAYIDYVDFRTLAILFCLMAVMAGLQAQGLFKQIAKALLNRVHSLRQLILILLLLCFFFSMVITNDVALITFVPLTLTIVDLLDMAERKEWIIPIVVMQTIAANLGSMLTPIGNPQNLYLYGRSGMSAPAFFSLMLPYASVALVLLIGWSFLYCRKRNVKMEVHLTGDDQGANRKLLTMYAALFLLSLMVVARLVSYPVVLGIVLAAVLIADRKTLKHVDYSLLLTFVSFFVFIGNMGRIPSFRNFLQQMIEGHETLTAIAASQVISNVPAALLLSGFTDQFRSLIIGTNLGGLGTLIASMASLISFKYIAAYDSKLRGRYFQYFTLANVVFLVIMLGSYFIIA
ncbi:MAG: citrate transporter [Oscillibacter sp.]|nr:citrate transporter [Oscillibacter sp.]